MHIIAYSSHSLIADENLEKELNNIRNTGQSNNLENGITGALFYKGGTFLQILEGQKQPLQELMNSIKKDKRHQDVTYLVDHAIETRSLNAWSMEVIDLENRYKLGLQALQKTTKSFYTTFFTKQKTPPNAALILDFYNSLLK